jgi:predicted TIM-barrel fold metal-dependent hydrolase
MMAVSTEHCPPPQAARKPRHTLPAGTTDCHCHVFEDPSRYPLAPGRSYTPPLCTVDDYVAMCHTLGIERTVQVNASVYGFDNSVTLDLIAKLGQDKARGVAGVSPDATDAELARLHEGGMRGARLSTLVKGYGGTDAIEAIAAKIKPFGWHLQLHVGQSAELAALEPRLMNLGVPLVFDHLGSTRGGEGVGAPGFQAMLRVLKGREDAWVKISSWYRRSDGGMPDYADMKPLAQALVAARPDRCVWGSNWPHPGCDVAMPNDGDLIDLFCEWVPDPAVRRGVLVTNPARLYGFE